MRFSTRVVVPLACGLLGFGSPGAPARSWVRTYAAAPGLSTSIFDITAHPDGGWVAVGAAGEAASTTTDAWVAWLDAAGGLSGDLVLGVSGHDDQAVAVTTTVPDRGLAVAGTFGSGGSSFGMLKLDASGALEWQRLYASRYGESASAVFQDANGDLVTAGWGESADMGRILGAWLAKASPLDGEPSWELTSTNLAMAGPGEIARDIIETADGGHAFAGSVFTSDVLSEEAWLVKLNELGELQWQALYGVGRDERIEVLLQTSPDEGFFLAGMSDDATQVEGDLLLVKVDATGAVEWQLQLGGDMDELPVDALQAADGGYLVAAQTESFGDGVEAWLVKLDAAGAIEWQRRYGGPGDDWAAAVKETATGYVLAGSTTSHGVGTERGWLVSLDADGKVDPACGSSQVTDAVAVVGTLTTSTHDAWLSPTGGPPSAPGLVVVPAIAEESLECAGCAALACDVEMDRRAGFRPRGTGHLHLPQTEEHAVAIARPRPDRVPTPPAFRTVARHPVRRRARRSLPTGRRIRRQRPLAEEEYPRRGCIH